MLKQLINRILTRKIAGVQLNLTDDGCQLNLIICQRQGSTFLVKSQHPDLSDFEELKELVGSNTAVVCVISGKGILHHQLQHDFKDWNSGIRERLPGAKTISFVGQSNQAKKLIAFTRLDVIRGLMDKLVEKELFPISINLGVLSAESLLQLLEEDKISLPPYSIQQKNGEIIQVNSTKVDTPYYQIADQEIAASLVLPLGAALGQIMGFPRNTFQLNDEEHELANNFRYNQYTRWLGIGGLGSIFIALAINFICFGSYSQKLSIIEGELYYAQSHISQIDSLNQQLKEKKMAIEKLGPGKNSKLSFYADEIANSLPFGIKLTQLNISPIVKDNRSDKKNNRYETGNIQIKGENQDGELLNNWISRLENLDWVAEVKLQPYKMTSGKGEFELLLKTK